MHDYHVQIMVINMDGYYQTYKTYTGQVWVDCSREHFTVMGKMQGSTSGSNAKDVVIGRYSLNRFAFNQDRISDSDKVFTPQWEEGSAR